MTKLKIKTGDTVIVITGKDKGKKGIVSKVFPKENKLIIIGINTFKKHTKPSQTSEGGIIFKEMPIHISNVAYYDNESNASSKIGYQFSDNGVKQRVLKKTSKPIEVSGK